MCYQPISMYTLHGRWSTHEFFPLQKAMQVPCGKCIECIKQKSIEYTYRVQLEMQHSTSAWFVTLTYANAERETLDVRDFQLFMKRLRKNTGFSNIRYFGCGEYGSKKGRKHFHLCLFNCDIVGEYNEYFFTNKQGNPVYKNKLLSDNWKLGFVTVEEPCDGNLIYLSKYMQKFNEFDKFDSETGEIYKKSFFLQSKGIGKDAIDKKMLETDKMYLNGRYHKLPRYFVSQLQKQYPDEVERLKWNRLLTMARVSFSSSDSELQARRELEEKKLKEKVLKARYSKY